MPRVHIGSRDFSFPFWATSARVRFRGTWQLRSVNSASNAANVNNNGNANNNGTSNANGVQPRFLASASVDVVIDRQRYKLGRRCCPTKNTHSVIPLITISMVVGTVFEWNDEMYNWDYFEDIPEYHPIADANNLYDAFWKARKGSHWKASVQRFRWELLEQVRKLQIELDNFQHGKPGAYQLSPYSKFIVNERGKTRAITALQIRDRVVKHVLNDVYLLPHIRPYLIYDNGASLKGKGVDFTRRRLIAHLESYFWEYGTNEGYIMTMDFSGYYDNIDHAEAIRIIGEYEHDEFAMRLVRQAFDSYNVDVSYMTDEEYEEAKVSKFSTVDYRLEHHPEAELTGEKYLYKSLSVGDQTSQITAILLPTEIDKLVTIVLGQKYYARYMDDLYVIARTKEELIKARESIEETARKLKLFINPKKTKILRLDRTFKFLQFKYYLASNGHVVVRINPKTVTRMKRKLKKLSVLFKNDKVPMDKIESLFRSWIRNYGRYMSQLQLTHTITLYRNLFGNGLNEWLKGHFEIYLS